MALEHITESVLNSARTEADRIRRSAEKAAADRLKAGRQAVEAEGERRYQAAVRAIDEGFARELTQLMGAAKKELLAAKSACVDRVFETARQQILDLPEEAYCAVMRRLLDRAAQGHGGAVRVHPGEQRRFRALIDEYNAAWPGADGLSLDESVPLAEPGGFVFVSDTYQVDATLTALLRDLEYELAPQVAAALFDGPGGDGAQS